MRSFIRMRKREIDSDQGSKWLILEELYRTTIYLILVGRDKNSHGAIGTKMILL